MFSSLVQIKKIIVKLTLKHVHVTELDTVVARTLRFRGPVGKGYLRPHREILRLSPLLLRSGYVIGPRIYVPVLRRGVY